jgi:outer membrane protein assembly factor BamE
MHLHKAMGILRLTPLVYIAVIASTGGCSLWNSNYVPSLIKPHKVDIQQGNFVTQQDVDRLQIGMTRDQVRFILGTPLLNSPFHSNRWDYVYRLAKADGAVVQYRYTVVFENDKLARHNGEKLPNNQSEFLSNK